MGFPLLLAGSRDQTQRPNSGLGLEESVLICRADSHDSLHLHFEAQNSTNVRVLGVGITD